MGGEGDLKAAPGGARARRTGRPHGARGLGFGLGLGLTSSPVSIHASLLP